MLFNYDFALFQDDGERSIWRGSFADFDLAKHQAQIFADAERMAFFVLNVGRGLEVARILPSKRMVVSQANKAPMVGARE